MVAYRWNERYAELARKRLGQRQNEEQGSENLGSMDAYTRLAFSAARSASSRQTVEQKREQGRTGEVMTSSVAVSFSQVSHLKVAAELARSTTAVILDKSVPVYLDGSGSPS